MDTDPGEVVLDTNVFVAAGFNPGSHSARLVEAVRDGRLRMIWDAVQAPLVTSDAGLLDAGAQMTVPVLKPSEFARRFGALY